MTNKETCIRIIRNDEEVRLENWSVGFNTMDPYIPPELKFTVLFGNVYGHKERPDGDHIISSKIISAKGRHIITLSGSKYKLGKIDPKYRKHLKKINYKFDYRNPIKIKKEDK